MPWIRRTCTGSGGPGRDAASDGACRATAVSAGDPPRGNIAEWAGLRKWGGGESGIRTHGRVSPTHAFQACSFNRSDISPRTWLARSDGQSITGAFRPAAGQPGGGRSGLRRPRAGLNAGAALEAGGPPAGRSACGAAADRGVRRILVPGRGLTATSWADRLPDRLPVPRVDEHGRDPSSPGSRSPAGSLIGPGADGTLNPAAGRSGRAGAVRDGGPQRGSDPVQSQPANRVRAGRQQR